MVQIILASDSPRRKEILDKMRIPYQVMASNIKEEVDETEPAEMVQALASMKARTILAEVMKQELNVDKRQDYIILGADTMVFYREHALGKPKDEEDAVRMLKLLSDDVHEVYTGVSILRLSKENLVEEYKFAACTKVTVRPLSEEQIRDYIATGEPMDKAGAYAIQGEFGIYIKEIAGDYYNIVGFPIAKIYDTLLQHGIDIKKLK